MNEPRPFQRTTERKPPKQRTAIVDATPVEQPNDSTPTTTQENSAYASCLFYITLPQCSCSVGPRFNVISPVLVRPHSCNLVVTNTIALYTLCTPKLASNLNQVSSHATHLPTTLKHCLVYIYRSVYEQNNTARFFNLRITNFLLFVVYTLRYRTSHPFIWTLNMAAGISETRYACPVP